LFPDQPSAAKESKDGGLTSAGMRRDASAMISRQRVTAWKVADRPQTAKIEALDEAANQIDVVADMDKTSLPVSESIDRVGHRTRRTKGLRPSRFTTSTGPWNKPAIYALMST